MHAVTQRFRAILVDRLLSLFDMWSLGRQDGESRFRAVGALPILVCRLDRPPKDNTIDVPSIRP